MFQTLWWLFPSNRVIPKLFLWSIDPTGYALCPHQFLWSHLLLFSPPIHCISYTGFLLAVPQTYQAYSLLGAFVWRISSALESHPPSDILMAPPLLPSGLYSTVILTIWESLHILPKISPHQLFLYSFPALYFLLNIFFIIQHFPHLSCFVLFLPSQLKYLPLGQKLCLLHYCIPRM